MDGPAKIYQLKIFSLLTIIWSVNKEKILTYTRKKTKNTAGNKCKINKQTTDIDFIYMIKRLKTITSQ